MGEEKVNAHGLDISFKKAFLIFRNKVLDFLGLNIPRISGVLSTEFPEIKVTKSTMDMVFRLEDGSILHLEPESELSLKDTLRFLRYDIELYTEHRAKIKTIVLCDKKVNEENLKIDGGSLEYQLEYLDMSKEDGDAKLEEIKHKIKRCEKINELELIFIPLMKSKREKGLVVKEVIEIEKQVDVDWEIKEQMVLTTLVLSNKLISKEYFDEVLGGIRMISVIEYGLQKAKNEGIDEGRKEGVEAGRKEGVEVGRKEGVETGRKEGVEVGRKEGIERAIFTILMKKFDVVPLSVEERIKQETDIDKLNVILMNAFSVKNIEEFIKSLES